MKTQLAIIGGGPGGYAAAFLAADLGMEVTLVEMEPRLGGVCLLRGCIPSKALLHVAKVLAGAKHLGEWGVTFTEPTIDLDAVRARKDKIIATLAGGLAQLAKRRKVRVVQARATFENSETLRLHPVGDASLPDDRIQFGHCVVATGSVPATIPGLDSVSPRVMNSTRALQLVDVPKSLLIVGGGYIGLELGTVYAALGSRVWVVEMTDGLLPGADRDLVKPLAKKLAAEFEAIWLGTKVASLADKGQAIEVTFEDAGCLDQSGALAQGAEGRASAALKPGHPAPPKPHTFDRVLVSVGRRPASADLGLENTQVSVNQRDLIAVDAQLRTTDPRILAIGDVAGDPMLAHKAAHQGRVAVEALAGKAAAFQPRAIPAVAFTDPEIAWAGLTEQQAKAEGRRVAVAQFPWAASGRALAVGRTEGLTKWLVDPESERLLGCGIVGAGAGDLIGEAVLAIEMGAAVGDVTDSIHPHPTLTETLRAAAEVYFGTATDLYRPKRG